MKRFTLILCVALTHLQAFGQTADEHFNAGIKKFKAQNYETALAEFNTAIELDPNNSKTYNNRGIIKNMLNDSAGSIADFNKAIELKHNSAVAYKNRALLKMQYKNYSGALADFNKVLQFDPNDEVAMENKKQLKKLLQTKQEIEKKVVEQKKDTLAVTIRDTWINAEKTPEPTTDTLKTKEQPKAAGVKPSVKNKNSKKQKKSMSAEEYVGRGRSRAQLHKYKAAFEDYSAAIEVDSTYAQAYYYRGLLKSTLRNYTSEMEKEEEGTFKEKYHDMYTRRELLKGDLGAIEDYTKAIRLNPKFVDAYYNRAMSFYNLKEYRNAIANFNEVIRLNSNYADAFYYRGLAKGILLDMNGACIDFVKAAELGNTEAKDLLKDCQ